MSQAFQIGDHLWAHCGECGRLVKLTGWSRGIHFCLTDEEIQAKRMRENLNENADRPSRETDPQAP